MTLDLDAACVRRRIEARRRDGRWEITLDGRQLDANLVAANGRWSLLVAEAAARSDPAAGDAEGDGSAHAGPDDEVPGGSRAYRSYEVAADGQHVYVNGRAIAVTVDDPRAPRARDAASTRTLDRAASPPRCPGGSSRSWWPPVMR